MKRLNRKELEKELERDARGSVFERQSGIGT
jgi:hypothetical protein